MSDLAITRRFVDVEGRTVHYLLAGQGPPVVLLHDSVKSSNALLPLVRHLASNFTVFAPDTPGYGNSQALPGTPTMRDFARAIIATLDALGLPRVCIFGRHTSAKMVLEVLIEAPERFDVAIMDGLALGNGPADPDYIAQYLPPLELDPYGAYLAQISTQAADIQRWYPWFRKYASARMDVAVRDGDAGQDFLLDFLMAGPSYSSAYAAALSYDGWPRIALLDAATPAVFMAGEDDVLSPFLDRLPDGLRKERVPTGEGAIAARVEQLFQEYSTRPASPAITPQPRARHNLALPHGTVHIREQGPGEELPILYLHEVPGGASGDCALISALATSRRVIAPDLPGGGESSPLPQPDIDAYADVLARIVSASGAARVDVVATTTSTPLAVAFAARHAQLVRGLVLNGLVPAGPDLAERYCPPIRFERSGAHLQRLWHMLRNQEVQWPWYSTSASAIRWNDPDLDPARLHARLLDVVKQLPAYGDAARAALAFDTQAALLNLDSPALLLTSPRDPAYTVPRPVPGRMTVHPHAAQKSRVAQDICTYLANL